MAVNIGSVPFQNPLPDDILLLLGTDGDGVLVNRSTTLAANTALTGVLIGTPVTPAIAANSLIIANVTAAGDILMAGNRGGNSEDFLFYDSSAGALYLSGYAGGVGIGLAGGMPAPDGGSVHIWNATAGVVTAQGASELVIENSAASYLEFLHPATSAGSGIFVSSPTASDVGQLLYSGATGSPAATWRVFTANTERLRYSAAAFAFQEATTVSTTTGGITIDPAAGIGLGAGSNTTYFLSAGGNGDDVYTSAATTGLGAYVVIRPSSVANTSAGTGDVANLHLGPTSLNPVGAASIGANLYISSPGKGGAGTFTNMASAYIAAAPTGGTNNYAFWVDAGVARLDGEIQFASPAAIGAAAADLVRLGITDIAAADARFSIQSETGSAIYLGNDRLRFAATTGIIGIGATDVLSLTSTAVTLADAVNIAFNATTGTKLGSATTQKLSFWNATPVVQGALIADASGGATIDAEARTAVNTLLARMRTYGLIAT